MARNDLEQGLDEIKDDDHAGPLPRGARRLTWRLGMRTPTSPAAGTRFSVFTRLAPPNPIGLLGRPFQPGGSQRPASSQEDLGDSLARREFLSILLGGRPEGGPLRPSCDWLTSYIEEKCDASWISVIQPSLTGLDEASCDPSLRDFSPVYRILTRIVHLLLSRSDLAFVEIVEDLLNGGLLKDMGGENEHANLWQTCFALLGWITFLYEPRQDSKAMEAKISRFGTSPYGNKILISSLLLDKYGQSFADIDMPIWSMLSLFGQLIPDLARLRKPHNSVTPEVVSPSLVSYRTLRKVCHIDIVWVDTMGLHLDFDSTKKQLKIFRFPTFCRLMFHQKKCGVLSKLFQDNARGLRGEAILDSASATNDFFRELLLTYRLIFGQDARSWKLFTQEMQQRRRSHRTCILDLPDTDPLLSILCGQDCGSATAASIYQEIHAEIVLAYYEQTSFPYFAKNILGLQDHTLRHHTRGWMALWRIQWDKSDWWQFWVLIIGAAAIALSIMSLVAQIWQVVLTQKQISAPAAVAVHN